MKYLSIRIHKNFPEEEALHLLKNVGLTFLFSTEAEESKEIAVSWHENPKQLEKQFTWILSITQQEYQQVDWDDQWKIHGENYRDGIVAIDLEPYGISNSFNMQPGPGFGDLSHTTTRLTMQMMLPLCKNKHVVDVGCGSGVLSLAATCGGAKQVYAIDIDPLAIEHTKINAALNGFEGLITYELPEQTAAEFEWLIAMNMIHSEQREAWNSIKETFSKIPYEVITSGILESDKQLYIAETKSWGWEVKREVSEGKWSAFTFASVF